VLSIRRVCPLLCFLPSCVTIYLLPAVVTCKWMPSLALAYITCQHSVSGLPVCAAISLQIFFISLSSIILGEHPCVATETYNTHILYISHCDIICQNKLGNRLALALFQGPPAAGGNNGSWEAFPSNGGNEVTSAWQNPAAEPGKADWELALVETASNLSMQKPAMSGGMDPLLLNGMYDQGVVRQHVSAQVTTGSASSVALPAPGQKTQMLALPAPDGSMQTVGGDPFAASLAVPPPSYVQMADLEKKQQLLSQEQIMWQQYQRDGMQGQSSLNKLDQAYHNGLAPNPGMPYGMPAAYNTGYYYPTY
jgi:hypothetical protein